MTKTEPRKVKVLNLEKLATNQQVKFTDGTTYRKEIDGSLQRVSPVKPWTDKASHKAHKKERRIAREEAK